MIAIDKNNTSTFNWVSFGLGMIVLIIGMMISIDWLFDLKLSTTLFAQLTTTKPITAVCIVFSGISLILQSFFSPKKIIQVITQLLSAFIIVIAIFSLLQILWGLQTNALSAENISKIQEFFNPGQMPPTTAFCFILIGVALYIQSLDLKRFKTTILYALISMIIIIGLLVILGYLSEYFFTFHIWSYAGVAIQTPIALILIGISLYFLAKEQKEFVWSLEKSSALAFMVGILALLIIASLSEYSIRNMRELIYKKTKMEDMINQVGVLQSDFLNYLTAERIYIITGDENLLGKQVETKEKIIKDMTELSTRVNDSPKLKAIFDQTQILIDKKIETINNIIQVRKTKGLTEATNLVVSSGNMDLTNSIDHMFTDLRHEAYLDLKKEITTEEHISQRTFQLLPIGILSSLTILFLAISFLNMRITERKIALEQKSKLEDQLRQSQKMDAIGQLTGGIAHDFNNLLGIVIGNLDLLEGMVEGNESALKRVKTASNAALRGAEITKRLLSFSRFQQLKPANVSVNESIKNAIALISRAMGPAIKIIEHLDETLPPVFIDTIEFENVLVNLSVNARDAMPKGGTLMFITEFKTLKEDYSPVQTKDLKAGNYACITVSDTGAGMPREIIEKAFEPFFTTKPAGKGTGLGLAMAYGFAKQSQGYIRIYSEVNHGTSIVLYLPFAEKTESVETNIKKIGNITFDGIALLVDDEPDLLDIGSVYLKEMGFQVIQASNGPEALEILNKTNISLLVTDVIMPGGMNGFELAKAAKTIKPSLIVVYTSGFHANILSEKTQTKLDAPLITKPYQKNDFIVTIQDTLKSNSESNKG